MIGGAVRPFSNLSVSARNEHNSAKRSWGDLFDFLFVSAAYVLSCDKRAVGVIRYFHGNWVALAFVLEI